nr:hypothetical protein [Tanacetum cinerariifolium]
MENENHPVLDNLETINGFDRHTRVVPSWRLRKLFTSFPSAHVPENIPAGAAVNKGKAPMDDDSLLADLLFKQEHILKNLHDYQLSEDLAKKLHAKQEAEFARQQEELAHKAQAERVASHTEHDPGLSDQRRRELDAAQLIYTETDWVELFAKITTNSALSKQLLGDDVTEDNMNERLGWTMKKVKTLSITQLQHEFEYIQRHLERSNLLNFRHSTFRPKPTLDAPSARRANQGVPQVPATPSQVPAAASRSADTPTSSVYVFVEHSVAASTYSSSRRRRKHIAKKRVTPIVDIADAALIKFDSDTGSDDDPLPAIFMCYFSLWMMRMPMISGVIRIAGAFAADVYILVLSAATLERMLKHGLEVPKLLVGGELTMVE